MMVPSPSNLTFSGEKKEERKPKSGYLTCVASPQVKIDYTKVEGSENFMFRGHRGHGEF